MTIFRCRSNTFPLLKGPPSPLTTTSSLSCKSRRKLPPTPHSLPTHSPEVSTMINKRAYEEEGGDGSGVNEVFKDSNWANRGPSLRWWRTLTSSCYCHNCISANISLLKPGKYWSQLKILGQDQVLVMTENESYEDCSVATHPIEFDTF